MVQALQGKRMIGAMRLLENANKEDAEIIPLQGDSSLSLKRDSKSTTTKSGNISAPGGLTTEIDQTFYECISKVSDEFYDAVLDNKIVEFWLINLDRVNSEGKHWSIYVRANVTEDKPSFKADGTAERSPKMSVIGTPQRGYTALSDYQEAMIDYAYRGIGKVAENATEDGTAGNGTPYDAEKALTDTVPSSDTKETDSGTTQSQPKASEVTANAN